MALKNLLNEMDSLGIGYVFANGAPSESLLKDAIKAEKEFKRSYGDMVERNFAAQEQKHETIPKS